MAVYGCRHCGRSLTRLGYCVNCDYGGVAPSSVKKGIARFKKLQKEIAAKRESEADDG